MMHNPNRLAKETSPYLLQHANNPVDWYPWGEEAIARAVAEDKPILVSIGYSACHWCHVMERESFENEETAALMNRLFINIKIDREERPDLDHIYMDAVQAMTGSGGWPLNVFLTPGKKPFYGGTYFPPARAFNRPSWSETLAAVAEAFRSRREDIETQAENCVQHLLQSNEAGSYKKHPGASFFTQANCDKAFEEIMKSADREWGGFGNAPKFPQTFIIQYLLRYYFVTKNEDALAQACLSLDKMIEGGIYDQLGGGFARYSTDNQWLAPHFEKMLYDNALLVSVLAEAYQATRKPRYREVIYETIDFIKNELQHPLQGFYSALDADSEGVEGKFYVWSENEIDSILGNDATVFKKYYDITTHGNWEEKNILRVKKSPGEFSLEHEAAWDEYKKILQQGREKLLEKRSTRIRPQLDDKILLGWNALMNTALGKAFEATGENNFRELAIANMKFLSEKFILVDEKIFHVWKNEEAKFPAFLDDLAFLVQAYLQLQKITGDTSYLDSAKLITEKIINECSDETFLFFYFTKKDQQDVIVRKKEIYDGAVPSGNAIMCRNLYELSILFDIPAWKERAINMLTAVGDKVTRYPSSFGVWANLLLEIVDGTEEIAILGDNALGISTEILALFLPHKVFMQSRTPGERFPLLAGKPQDERTLIYFCRNYACQQPVSSLDGLLKIMKRGEQ
jgi:uncharacterized protein YyaL (SSP411 family)